MARTGDNRRRKYLTPEECARLIRAAGDTGEYGTRDRALLLVMYRHGLRVSEAVALEWHQVDFDAGRLHVSRLKGSRDGTHILDGDTIRALRAARRDWPNTDIIFQSREGGNLSRCMVNRLIARAGVVAGIGIPVHPHMLRHSCGYALANAGTDTRVIQDYLGHVNIGNTVGYTQLSAGRFKGLGKAFQSRSS